MSTVRYAFLKWSVLFICFAFQCEAVFGQSRTYENSANYKAALAAIDNNDYALGVEYLVKELAQHPENGYAYYQYASVLFASGDLLTALQCADMAVKYIPASDKMNLSRVFYLRAKVKAGFDNYEAALADVSYAISLNTRELDLYQLRSDIYRTLSRYNESDDDCRKMLSLHPGYIPAEVGLAKNNIARSKYEEALQQLNRLIKKRAGTAEVYGCRAAAYWGMDNVSASIDDLIVSFEKDITEGPFLLMLEISLRDFKIVADKLEGKRSSDSSDKWPFCLGAIYELSDNVDKAIYYFQEAFGIDSRALYASCITSCYMQRRDWDNAILYADKAIAVAGNNINYYLEKAEIYWYAGRLADAVKTMTSCIESNPNSYILYLHRGFYNEYNGNKAAALDDYTKAIAINPNCASARMLRGRIHWDNCSYDAARADFELCVALDKMPTLSSAAHFALFYLGRRAEAESYLNDILKYQTYDAYYHAACLYSLMNNKAKALEYLEKALEAGYCNYYHLLRDSNLKNIRHEYAFKQMFEKYSGMQFVNLDKTAAESEPVRTAEPVKPVPVKAEPKYTYVTTSLPYVSTYGMMQVKGNFNGYSTNFTYIPTSCIAISLYQAEYYLSVDLINQSSVSGNGRNGELSVGDTIRMSIRMGDFSIDDVEVKVISNDNPPFIFGDKLFGNTTKVSVDKKRSAIVLTTKIQINK